MTVSRAMHDPPLGLGLMSVLLGSVGLLLAGLPVLGIPLAAVGLLVGLGGFLADLLHGRGALRWSVGGLVLSALALTLSVAIHEAPEGYLPARRIPLDTQPVPLRPYIPPPARPSAASAASSHPGAFLPSRAEKSKPLFRVRVRIQGEPSPRAASQRANA